MENISDWFLNTIRDDEKKGIASGWLEEKRFLILPNMVMTLKHILEGGSVIILTDEQREWFGDYIITHINQHHKGRPFFPIVQIKYLHDMIDSSNKDGDMQGFMPIINMLDMMYRNYHFWYIGKKNVRVDFAKHNQQGWHWIFDENDMFSSTDEKLDYKLINLFKLFERALLAAMLNKISLDI